MYIKEIPIVQKEDPSILKNDQSEKKKKATNQKIIQ